MNLVVFFMIAALMFAVGHFLIGRRLIRPARLRTRWNAAAWILLGVFWATPLASMLLFFTGLRPGWGESLAWVGFVSLGFFTVVATLLLFRDAGWIATTVARKLSASFRGGNGSRRDPDRAADPDRRRFLIRASSLGVVAAAGGLTGYGIRTARARPRFVDVNVPIRNLPAGLDGLRIAQITDIHVGPTIKRAFVQDVVEAVNSLGCDLIAFTGDLVDGSVPQLRRDVAPLGDLSAPLGAYFVTGNHEYYSGVEPWTAEARRLGFDVLNNEHRIVHHRDAEFVLAGVTDYRAGRYHPGHVSDPDAAFSNAPTDLPRILLAHQPASIYRASEIGCDLQLSGHTHGGQFFPVHFFAAMAQPYISGLHMHGDTWIYVSRGTGYWGPPIRLGAPSEITAVTLTRRPDEA